MARGASPAVAAAPPVGSRTMNADPLRRTVTISNPQGLHMRPMQTFVNTANQYRCSVRVSREGQQAVDGKSMILLLGLAAEAGAKAAQAQGRADEAHANAGQALTKADETGARLTRLWANRHRWVPGDSVSVLFRFDRADLDDSGTAGAHRHPGSSG